MTIKTNINSHEIKHLNIFKKGFFPQLMKFSTGLCTLSNKNPQQVASDNDYLTSGITSFKTFKASDAKPINSSISSSFVSE